MSNRLEVEQRDRQAAAEALRNQPSQSEIMARAREIRAAETIRVAGAIARQIQHLKDHVEEALSRARTARELSRLDDRMLADIGISRSDIPAILVHGTVDRSGQKTPAEAAADEPKAPRKLAA